MTASVQQIPGRIEAAVDPEALQRVPSFFGATLGEILTELLQNARRAGATRVDITCDGDRMTVADNGKGIARPEALLVFGRSLWSRETAEAEHPAGIGFYSLARRPEVIVVSKSLDGPAWEVTLNPDHFTGRASAPVNVLDGRETPRGTKVTFSVMGELETLLRERVAQDAARHCPVEVHVKGQRAFQRDFLEKALLVREWRGVRIGVFREDFRQGKLNFHGALVENPELGRIYAVDSHWYPQVDVVNCPELELTLPARKSVVETPFMDELRQECRRTVFQAMRDHPAPVDVDRKIQKEAAELGVTLPDARPLLAQWRPGTARRRGQNSRGERQAVKPDSLAVDLDFMYPADQQALERAFRKAGMTGRLMQARRGYEGYEWYDRIPKIEQVRILVTGNGVERNLEDLRAERARTGAEPRNRRVEAVAFQATVAHPDGSETRLRLPGDVAFESDKDLWENAVLAARDTDLDADELARMLHDAYFKPTEDRTSDSLWTQEDRHQEECQRIALSVLASEEDALRDAIESAARRHMLERLPQDTEARISISRRSGIAVILERTEPDTP